MHKPCLFSFNLSFWKLLILQNISKEGRQNLIDVHHIPSQFENFTTAQWTHICRFPSLGKPWLDLEYRCWTYEFLRRNSNVQHRYSNIGLFNSAPIFAKFDDFMIGLYISSFIGTIYIEKSLKLAKMWAEMRKPSLEYLCWT